MHDDPSMNFEIVTVTPSLAREWIVKLPENGQQGSRFRQRSLSSARVAGYARDMLAGKWYLTHQGIAFNEDGHLIDGQHTLAAVAVAGATNPDIAVPMTVARGVMSTAMAGIDNGYGRTTSHALQVLGNADTSQLGAIARRAVIWDAGKPWTGAISPTRSEIIGYVDKHPDLHDAAKFAHGWKGRAYLAPAVAGFCWWLFQAIDREDADAFMSDLATGAGLVYGNPVLTLRDRFTRMRTPPTRGAVPERHRPETYIAFTIMAWKKHRVGEPTSKYLAPAGGFTNDNFPRPDGN